MSSGITFQYSAWFILLCLILGATYAIVLYYKDKTFKDPSPLLRKLIIAMGILRFLTISALAILLLSPLLKAILNKTEKPIIVMLHDNSTSIIHTFNKIDSVEYIAAFEKLVKGLELDYKVKQYTFGSDLNEQSEFSFHEKTSNISSALYYISDLYDNQNLGAVIMATDGIYNQGSNPLYSGAQISAPVYMIALGDTVVQKDLVLEKSNYNRISYLGDNFSIKVNIKASNCTGEKTNLILYQYEAQKKKKIDAKEIIIDEDIYDVSISFIIKADKPGIQHFIIELDALDDEITYLNNQQDVFIEIIDARQKILILGSAPHPDLSALKQAIESNDNYEVNILHALQFVPAMLNEYTLIILHQLPTSKYRVRDVISNNIKTKVPIIFILGSNTDLVLFNKQQPILKLKGSRKQFNEVQAVINKDFTLFNLTDLTRSQIKNFPPLTSFFGEYLLAPNAHCLLYQKIGSIKTEYPLLAFSQGIDYKIGLLCGEGIWKWRLNDYKTNRNHIASNEFINKMIQYLSVKADKRKFRVLLQKNNYFENEPLLFEAELYDEAYELINSPEVNLIIMNEEGKEFPYSFSRTEKAYSLNAGNFPVGRYSYSAEVVINNNKLKFNGEINISPLRLESMSITANHGLLYMLADKFGGKLVFPNGLNQISTYIAEREDVKPITYTSFEHNPLINLKVIFVLLLILISAEWFIRKLNGAY